MSALEQTKIYGTLRPNHAKPSMTSQGCLYGYCAFCLLLQLKLCQFRQGVVVFSGGACSLHRYNMAELLMLLLLPPWGGWGHLWSTFPVWFHFLHLHHLWKVPEFDLCWVHVHCDSWGVSWVCSVPPIALSSSSHPCTMGGKSMIVMLCCLNVPSLLLCAGCQLSYSHQLALCESWYWGYTCCGILVWFWECS